MKPKTSPAAGLAALTAGVVLAAGAYKLARPAKPQGRRERAIALLRGYVPSDAGDGRFEEIAKDFGGKGTTCGYLVSWLLWRLGLRQSVNRSEPAAGLSYTPGANMARVAGHPAFVAFDPTSSRRPKPGDPFFQSDGPPESEHAGAVIAWPDDEHITTADAGQRNEKGAQAARFVERRLTAEGMLVRKDGLGPPRKFRGWVDLEKAT